VSDTWTPPWTPPPLPEQLMRRGTDGDVLGKELMGIIEYAITQHPRTLQKRIGPSEVGHPCARRTGYKLMGAPEFNPNQGVAWKPTIGTATHTWLEGVFDRYNLNLGPEYGGQERFLLEQQVDVGEIGGVYITGHSDVYDRVTCTVVDWKVTGPGMLKGYKRNGPGHEYRAQGHLYGRGFTRLGLPVERVMIVFLPRNEELHHAHIWHEPYDEQVALDALAKANGIDALTKARGVEALTQLPTADAYCHRCPFFKAGSVDLKFGCPGDPASQRTPAPALTLDGQGTLL
jgi:hypothetical protein